MNKVLFHSIMGFLLVMSFILASARYAPATEEYAAQTGKKCAACHLDPSGGGELKPDGKAYAATLHSSADHPTFSTFSKVFRLLIGYLHILTAFFWFGTILYVHLVLKPAYASSGLPRGELRVGVFSMIIMAISGTILTCYRFNSLETLLHSRFGILLLIKISLFLIMVISAIIVITVIGPRLRAQRKDPLPTPASGDMTLEELAACNGIEGRPAYFAYHGKIYDASQSRLWKQGVHMGRHNAGTDLSEALNQAPHNADKITAMPEIGTLIASGPRKLQLHERVFYFMAYMNLAFVLIIILILALWRWT